ncbi:MAG TPA: P-loop NTPase fold protein [Anaerolineales bacterium]|nr:P-loop NTPase fold protein [Anaerolineales bacterium]
MATPPTSPPPERHFITGLAGTTLYVSITEEPWRLPAHALVLPLGPRVGMNGQLASAYRRTLGTKMEEFRSMVQSMVESQTESKGLRPDRPVLVSLPDWVEWPRPLEPDPATKAGNRDRYVIAATAYATEQATVEGAAQAAGAVVRLASEAGLSHLTLPMLGTGQGELPSDQVMRAMVAAIQSVLLTSTYGDRRVQEITLVTLNPDAAAAAFDFFSRRAQHPINDLPQGRDLLNITIEARALAETLLLRDLDPPISVGIIGGWGSGKSFIMHLMQERMTELRMQKLVAEQTWPKGKEEEAKAKLFPYVGHIYQIKFDAWTYAKGDLWSSLMQTIFFELNRQISLEKRLREAYMSESIQEAGYRFLLEGGECWRALNEMSDETRDALLKAQLVETAYEKWKKQTSATIDDVLWEELKELQREQREKLKAALAVKEQAISNEQTDLQNQQQQLAKTEADLKRLKEQDITHEAQEQALRALPAGVLKTLGINALVQLQAQLKAATAPDGTVTAIDLEAIKPNSSRIFIDEVLRDPGKLGWFLTLVLVGTAFFLLAAVVRELVPQLAGILLALVAYLSAGGQHLRPWLNGLSTTLKAWDESIKSVYESYKQELEKRRTDLERQTNQAIGQQETHKTTLQGQIAASEQKLSSLRAQVDQHRWRLSPIASYDTLLEFVNSRLSDTYEEKLGFVHFVQRDLRELTASLVADLDKPERIPDRLRDLFPRGPARIVLFIDDLDRCPPDQVVQVLEAAQLLLKTELFVVVMAIDVRYVARALEKAYDRILVRRGKPSGLDYIEKIIQIPYRVRPIEPEVLEGYLRAQMQVEKPKDAPQGVVAQTLTAGQSTGLTAVRAITPARAFDIPPSQVLEFSEPDLQNLLACCRLVDLSPRAIKRLINVSKIIKVVWFRSRFQTSPEVTRGVFGLLALSDRFPDLMRDLFEDLAAHFRMIDLDVNTPFPALINGYQPIDLTDYQQREWARLLRLVNETDLLPPELSLLRVGLQSFNLVRSFCFVGDIGYDPQDDDRDREPKR